MSFHDWVRSTGFDFWFFLVLGVVSLLVGLYQLCCEDHYLAATFFFCLTVISTVVLGWTYFGRPRPAQGAPELSQHITWKVAPGNQRWTNAWPKLTLEPDAVPVEERNTGDHAKALRMWIEGIAFTPETTVVHLAVKNWTSGEEAYFDPSASAYIIDDRGSRYSLQEETRNGRDDDPFLANGEVSPGATERLQLTFPRMETTSFLLKHPQFRPLLVYRFEPPPVTVSFCRPIEVQCLACSLELSCDGHHVADLAVLKPALVPMRPGQHSCHATYKYLWATYAGDALDVSVASGRNYYIQVDNSWFGYPQLVMAEQSACPKPH